MVHVRHADALRLLGDGVLRLLLRADEEDGASALGDVAHEGVRLLDQVERLLEIDDVDAAPLREDVAAHLGVPAPRLVAEMHSGLQELAHADDGQADPPRLNFATAGGIGWNRVAPAPPPERIRRVG